MGTVSGSAPQLIEQHGLDNAVYGLGITLMSAATVGSMGISGMLARHFSHRGLLLAILPILFSSLWLLLSKGSVIEFFLFAIIYGVACGITDVIMNAEAGAIEQALGKRIYIIFHGMGSLFVAIFAILSSFLSTSYGTSVSVVATALPILIAIVLVFNNIHRSKPEPLPTVPERRLLSAFTPRLVLIGVTAGFVISCEIAALMWSSELLAQSAPQLAAIAGLGAAFFGLSNALLRFPGDWLRTHFSETTLMSLLMLVAAGGGGRPAPETGCCPPGALRRQVRRPCPVRRFCRQCRFLRPGWRRRGHPLPDPLRHGRPRDAAQSCGGVECRHARCRNPAHRHADRDRRRCGDLFDARGFRPLRGRPDLRAIRRTPACEACRLRIRVSGRR